MIQNAKCTSQLHFTVGCHVVSYSSIFHLRWQTSDRILRPSAWSLCAIAVMEWFAVSVKQVASSPAAGADWNITLASPPWPLHISPERNLQAALIYPLIKHRTRWQHQRLTFVGLPTSKGLSAPESAAVLIEWLQTSLDAVLRLFIGFTSEIIVNFFHVHRIGRGSGIIYKSRYCTDLCSECINKVEWTLISIENW